MRYVADTDKSKDLLHDCFIKIFEKMSLFTYRQEGSLMAWLSRLCVNESLMQLRRDHQFITLPLNERDNNDESIATPTPDAIEQIPEEVIEHFIAQLPIGYRTVFNLYVFEEKSHKEIAEMLGINEKSSSSQLARAKKQLASAVESWQKENA